MNLSLRARAVRAAVVHDLGVHLVLGGGFSHLHSSFWHSAARSRGFLHCCESAFVDAAVHFDGVCGLPLPLAQYTVYFLFQYKSISEIPN